MIGGCQPEHGRIESRGSSLLSILGLILIAGLLARRVRHPEG
jgi:hypothetical protein